MRDLDDSFFSCGTIISSASKGHLYIGFGKRTWIPQPDNPSQNRPTFFFPTFFLEGEKSWFFHESFLEVSLEVLIAELDRRKKALNLTVLKAPEWVSPYSALFFQSFGDLQEKFVSDELSKAVPYVFEKTCELMQKTRLEQMLNNLLNYSIAQSLYLYGFWDEHEGILGATPEILFRQTEEGRKIETMACAGTRARDSMEGSLLDDPKELHEHDIVVQSIVKELSSFGEVMSDPVRVLKLPKLFHLVTPIQVVLVKAVAFTKIVQALHPTPALGAHPRQAGNKWLRTYEILIPRGRFGAPVGYIFPEKAESECYVSIRNVQWNIDGMFIGAGCGIVRESQVEREWQEVQLKIQSIKDSLFIKK